ncbi:hypothetical protein Amsp01_069210 [Amycolatopsis sp. NBRC 101858]|nr:hypothetical protein Amsp01_069210 [Amycolatopsis sp. NBRC 101858]
MRDVEEHAEQPDPEDDGQQVPQPEHPEQRRDRDRPDQRRAPEVGGDQRRAVAHPVAPRADLQAQHQVGESLRGPQQGDLEDGRAERGGREQGDCQHVEPAAELAHEVGQPQPAEFAVSEGPHDPNVPRSIKLSQSDSRCTVCNKS